MSFSNRGCVLNSSQTQNGLELVLGNWWRHETWIPKILKFDFQEYKKSFWSEIKSIFLSLKSALF